jgi:hypothetical protein
VSIELLRCVSERLGDGAERFAWQRAGAERSCALAQGSPDGCVAELGAVTTWHERVEGS